MNKSFHYTVVPRVAFVAIVVLLLAAPAKAVDPQSARADRVAVLDAGTFLVVDAHNASLGQVLDQMKTRLRITFFDIDRLDLSQTVDGRKRGTIVEILRWLVPDGSFLLTYDDEKRGGPKELRPQRIYFLSAGNADTITAPSGPTIGKSGALGASGESNATVDANRHIAGAATTVSSATPQSGPGKPDVPDSAKSEIQSVTEQLWTATPEAQLQIEQQAHSSNRGGPPPDFLLPKSDAAQTTLQQQMERSQALAVEQLQMLVNAYKTTCKRKTPSGPC